MPRAGDDALTTPPARDRNGRWLLVIAAGALALLVVRSATSSWRLAVLALIGAALGATLFHSRFGFTAAWRRLLLHRDATGARAQLVMLALATVLFAPVLAAGNLFGREVVGAVAPVGWQVALGAALFGIGMQLGGGCGSGALYSIGGGSTRMLVTLAAFCAGGFWASLHMQWWQELPAWDAPALGEMLGWPAAVALQLAAIAVLALVLKRFGGSPPFAPAPTRASLARGPWPLLAGAAALALLNLATLLVAGHPWSITWAFTLWGAKTAAALGWDPNTSPFWNAPFQRTALDASLLDDVTSLMDLAIVIGALAAAAASGKFSLKFSLAPGPLVAAVLGGLAMGYGARLAYGCNVGAFFSGVASTSLHGWLWIAAALPGTWLGARLRPLFRLDA
jgi:uncharacterized membrane protein YedE/YeeE